MDSILTDFGIQPVYLAAQMFNFIILLLILKKFLYKPILKVLETRKKSVSDSLVKAEQIKNKLHATEQESAQKILDASKQAQRIIDKASKTASQIIADAHEHAHTETEKIIDQGKQNIQVERERMKKEMSNELAGLVILGVEKIAGKVLDQPDHSKIVNQTIGELKENISSKVV